MTRISYLSFDYKFLSVHCLETIYGLRAKNYLVDLYVPYDVIIDYPLPLECQICRIRFPNSHNKILRLINYQARLMERIGSDWLSKNRPDFIYSRYSFVGMPSIILSRFLNIPHIAEVNGITGSSKRKHTNLKNLVKENAEKTGLKIAEGIVVPSITLKRRVIAEYRVPHRKVHVIPNGFNPKLFFPDDIRAREFREQIGFEGSDFIIGFVGSLGEWQGLSTLKSAISKIVARKDLAAIKFLVAGDYVADSDLSRLKGKCGSGRRSIQHFIQDQGLWDRVTYLGHVSYEISADVMRASDVLVAPYTYEYILRGGGSPMKLYAYLGCEKPVIISDLGDFTDVPALLREKAAVIISPESPDQLVSTIDMLYRDPDQCLHLAVNGRQFVLKQRTWEHCCDRIASLNHRIT